MFELPAGLLSWFYGLTSSYIIAIALMSVVVMAITTPLTLKSTKGMLEMQRIAPEMRKLQAEYRNDRQKLNEEMMKLYQEHKVNPMASCLPIVAQMPVFIIMFRILRGWTYTPRGDADPIADATLRALGDSEPDPGFIPRYLSVDSDLFQAIYDRTDIPALGLDLGQSPFEAITDNVLTGLVYAGLVVLLGALYFGQQRMVAARATISPTMSATQQKIMQYLPVVFAVFQVFFVTALVVYYIFQTLLRILQQYYITKRFYGSHDSLGRQAQRASEAAREEAKKNGDSGGLFSDMKRQIDDARGVDSDAKKSPGKTPPKQSNQRPGGSSKRTTPPKNRPTSGGTSNGKKSAAGKPGGGKGRPTPSRSDAQSNKNRPKSNKKRKK